MTQKFVDLSKEEVQEALESYWGRRKVGHCIQVIDVIPTHENDGTFSGVVIYYLDDK